MTNGWIKLHRKVQGHWLYERKPFDLYHAWEDILFSVTHTPAKVRSGNRIINLKPGQMITSLSKLTEKWGWDNRSKTRRFLELLISDGMIEMECNTNETLLTVANWAKYQGDETQMEHGRNTDETRMKHPYYINKNIKNNKEYIYTVFEGYEFSENVKSAITDWLEYKKEKKQQYKPTGLKNLLSQIRNKLREHTEEQVIFVITESMASNYQGIVWDKLKNYHPQANQVQQIPRRGQYV